MASTGSTCLLTAPSSKSPEVLFPHDTICNLDRHNATIFVVVSCQYMWVVADDGGVGVCRKKKQLLMTEMGGRWEDDEHTCHERAELLNTRRERGSRCEMWL